MDGFGREDTKDCTAVSGFMTPRLVDVHTHTQFAAFRNDADAAIRRALDAGIWMINVGTQRDTSWKAVEFMHKYPEGVYATVGLHPIHTERSYHDEKELGISDKNQETSDKGFFSRAEKFDYGYYKKLAQNAKVVAIGECGLDYYRFKNGDLEFKKKQYDAFLQQIRLAHEVHKPLMIHCRDAFVDLIGILKSYDLNLKSPGIIHFFSGTKEDAKELLELGFSFSFGGVITFTHDYDEVVRYIPLERIALETDAPYVTPVPYRGKRNEPLYMEATAKKLSELKNIGLEEIAAITTFNAVKIFGL